MVRDGSVVAEEEDKEAVDVVARGSASTTTDDIKTFSCKFLLLQSK